MKRIALLALTLALLLSSCSSTKQLSYSWHRVTMDGSRTGVTTSGLDNIAEALGVVTEDGGYTAPSGLHFDACSATAKVAAALLAAQPEMAPVKVYLATSDDYMTKNHPDCLLGYFTADCMMAAVEAKFGIKVDASFVNLGGIRVDMPKGDVLIDDLMSMYPFKNHIIVYKFTGRQLLSEAQRIMTTGFQPIGGVTMRVDEDGHIRAMEVGGKPVEMDREYTVVANSFLHDGGDGFSLKDVCTSFEAHTDVMVYDLFYDYIKDMDRKGEHIKAPKGRRVVFIQ